MRIGAHDVEVIYSADADLELARDGLLAQADTEALTIKVRSDLPSSVRHECLLHEVLHHVWHQTALPELLDDDDEEVVIRSLASLLAPLVYFSR